MFNKVICAVDGAIIYHSCLVQNWFWVVIFSVLVLATIVARD